MRTLFTLLALTAFVGACSDNATSPTPSLTPSDVQAAKISRGGAGRIAFSADIDEPGNYDIYSMNSDGTGVTRLTTDPAADVLPSVSQNGRRIAFYSARGNTNAVYVMNADGTGVTPVFNALVEPYTGVGTEGFSLSADGTRIVFSGWDGSDREIYVINTDGTGLQQVTYNNDNDRFPSFGPKGAWIVFSSDRDGDYEVYTMKSDGSAVTRVTYSASYELRPAWSPDGKRIAFESYRDGETAVYTSQPNGMNVTRVTPVGVAGFAAAWAPGSKQLAFQGATGVWVVNTDGSGASMIGSGVMPSWGK